MTVNLPKLPAEALPEPGTVTWAAASATGSFIFPTHALLMKAIVDQFSHNEESTKGKAAVDPYNHHPRPRRDPESPKRRTLDDMRRLDEEIRAARRTQLDGDAAMKADAS